MLRLRIVQDIVRHDSPLHILDWQQFCNERACLDMDYDKKGALKLKSEDKFRLWRLRLRDWTRVSVVFLFFVGLR